MDDLKHKKLKDLLYQLSYEKKDVTLASGRKSNFYIDVKQTALHPEGAFLMGELIFDLMQKHFPKAQAIGGLTLGADPLVTATSIASFNKKPVAAFIVRKEPKKHGTAQWIEGIKNVIPGMSVVIIEDVVTTGESSIKAAIKAREYGLDVLGIIAVVDREEGGVEAIEKRGYKVVSLYTKSQLLS